MSAGAGGERALIGVRMLSQQAERACGCRVSPASSGWPPVSLAPVHSQRLQEARARPLGHELRLLHSRHSRNPWREHPCCPGPTAPSRAPMWAAPKRHAGMGRLAGAQLYKLQATRLHREATRAQCVYKATSTSAVGRRGQARVTGPSPPRPPAPVRPPCAATTAACRAGRGRPGQARAGSVCTSPTSRGRASSSRGSAAAPCWQARPAAALGGTRCSLAAQGGVLALLLTRQP